VCDGLAGELADGAVEFARAEHGFVQVDLETQDGLGIALFSLA